MTDMDLYYSEHVSQLNSVGLLEPGRLYAALVDNIWARVELIEYVEDGKVTYLL